jgi:HSP20 family protein
MGTTMSDLYSGTDLFSEFDRLQQQMGVCSPASPPASAPGASEPSRRSTSAPLTIRSISLRSPQGINSAELDVSIDRGLLTISCERQAVSPDSNVDTHENIPPRIESSKLTEQATFASAAA